MVLGWRLRGCCPKLACDAFPSHLQGTRQVAEASSGALPDPRHLGVGVVSPVAHQDRGRPEQKPECLFHMQVREARRREGPRCSQPSSLSTTPMLFEKCLPACLSGRICCRWWGHQSNNSCLQNCHTGRVVPRARPLSIQQGVLGRAVALSDSQKALLRSFRRGGRELLPTCSRLGPTGLEWVSLAERSRQGAECKGVGRAWVIEPRGR